MDRFKKTSLIASLLALTVLPVRAQDALTDENEALAIGSLRAIGSAQSLFREGDKDGNGVLDYAPNLEALGKTQVIDKLLSSGTKSGYTFKVTVSPKAPEWLWMATARPVKPGKTGTRYFATNHEGVIYQSRTRFAHNAECKLQGVLVGRHLPYDKTAPRTKPEGPWGKAIQAADDAQAFPYGKSKPSCFLSSKGDAMLVAGVRTLGRRTELESMEVDLTTLKGHAVSRLLDDQGRLQRLEVNEHTFPGGRMRKLLEATCREGSVKIVDIKARGPITKVWKPNTITMGQALFVLPLMAKLPASLTLSVARESRPLEGALSVAIAGDLAARTVTLKHPKLGEAVVTVKAGAIASWKGFDGRSWVGTTQEKLRAALAAKMKGPKLEKLKAYRQEGNEAAALGALMTLSSGQALYREADKDGNGVLDYAPNLKALGKTQLIDGLLANGIKQGYRFRVSRSAKTPEFLWMATAAPINPGESGTRYFAVNHAGVIYHALRPFAHSEDCKLIGVPAGQPLKGWKPSKVRSEAPTMPSMGEARAIGACRTVGTAQSLFREGDKEQDGTLDYAANLKELVDTKLISLERMKRSGYTFTLCHGSKAPEFTWMMVASPIKPGTTGDRHFATNHEGVTFYSDKPIKLDRVDCKIPAGLKPVGR